MSNFDFLLLKFPLNDQQKQLLETFKQKRQSISEADELYVRALERTKQFTRTVYPKR